MPARSRSGPPPSSRSASIASALESAIVDAGGPFASLITAIAFLGLTLWSSAGIRSTAFVILQWSAVALFSMFPWRGRVNVSDDLALWQLIRGGPAAAESQRSVLCTMSHRVPLRPRDSPDGLMGMIGDSTLAPVRVYDCYLAYVHHLDRGDVETAGRWLQRLLDQRHPNDPPEYLLEAAYFFAAHRQDVETARSWIAKEERDAEPWVRDRAEAAIAWASGDVDGAREQIERALTDLRGACPCSAHEYEIERIRNLQSRLPDVIAA